MILQWSLRWREWQITTKDQFSVAVMLTWQRAFAHGSPKRQWNHLYGWGAVTNVTH